MCVMCVMCVSNRGALTPAAEPIGLLVTTPGRGVKKLAPKSDVNRPPANFPRSHSKFSPLEAFA